MLLKKKTKANVNDMRKKKYSQDMLNDLRSDALTCFISITNDP